MVFSHQTRDECFEDGSNIPWNPPTNFHPDLIATCLLLLCALLSQQSHLFLICVVSTYNESRKDLHKLCQIPKNVSVNDFRLPIRLQEPHYSLLCLLRSFCCACAGLYPLCCQILYHHGISIFPLWARLFQYNFCKKPSVFSSSSRYRNLDPSESACRHCAYPNPVPFLLATPLVVHEKKSTTFSLNSGKSCNYRSLCTSSRPSF